MKSKLDMAHEYALEMLKRGDSVWSIPQEALNLAENMLSLFDSQEDKSRPEVLQDVVWLPDWSEAPVWANWWAMDEDGFCCWFENEPYMKSLTWMPTGIGGVDKAHSFNYQGNWVDSLRKRPQHY